MNKRRFLTFVLLISLTLVSSPRVAQGSTVPLPVWSGAEASRVDGANTQVQHNVEAATAPAFGKLPLSFVPNAGQTDPVVRFQVRSPVGALSFTSGEVVLSLPTPVQAPGRGAQRAVPGGALDPNVGEAPGQHRDTPTVPPASPTVLHMRFEGANPAPEVAGAERLPGIVNYFIGNDPAKWRTNLPTYAGVVYRELYPGVELHYNGVEGVLKGTYTVDPGADPSHIRWRYDGATSVRVDEATGDLLIRLPAEAGADGEGDILTERAPVAWQRIDGERVPVHIRYTIAGDGSIGFVLGDYDPAHPLILDPTLIYSTYLGGSGTDVGNGIEMDSAGNAYITGLTYSTDFPTESPLPDHDSLGGSVDVFVTKLNAAGSALLYSTYLGGSGTDEGQGVAVDSAGNAYVTGWTSSTDFPRVNPLDNTLGGRDAFVAKLDAAGSALLYSTYLGGSSIDGGEDIAVDSAACAYVVGDTFSTDFPTTTVSLQATYGGGTTDAFVAKLSAVGSALLYSTYLGGSGTDEGQGIALDDAGNAHVTGWTTSNSFPTANPLQPSNNGGPHDAFVAKLNAAGSGLLYSTYLGGSGVDTGDGIAVDSSGNTYVTGQVRSTDFPTESPLQPAHGGGLNDAFVAKLNPTGSMLFYSTYLGGENSDSGCSIAADDAGNAYVTGFTESIIGSNRFPADELWGTPGGDRYAFVTKLSEFGSALLYSTFLGGGPFENLQEGNSIAVDDRGNAYVTGWTDSSSFPTESPLYSTVGGGSDAFVTKIQRNTCSDGIKNGDEEGVDCGGTYCPPCSQCLTGAIYAPSDTPCEHAWPTGEGPEIGMNTGSNSCNLVEVCDPNLDYVIEDALLCCEYSDYRSKLSGNRASDKITACSYAHKKAYSNSFLDNFNPTTLKSCLAYYAIQSFGQNAVYMQGYFGGEWSCYGLPAGPKCPKWAVKPTAWEMGTAASCSERIEETPDFQMGGHVCEYYWTWIFKTIKWGKHGYWHSDTDWRSNSDSAADIPAHASINRLSTGTCVDYSFALTTILRKLGYSKDNAFSVNGSGHGYNLVRFPGEPKWHYVDTVGNNGGGVYGGSGFPDPSTAWYHYCTNLDEGCSNDYYSQSRSHCPSNDMIYGCEGTARASFGATRTMPWSMREVEPAPRSIGPSQADENCTELNPCVDQHIKETEAPGPVIDLEVSKEASSDEIVLGEELEIRINITNNEPDSVDVIAQETFVPGVEYDLEPKEGAYEGFHFQFYDWSLKIPAQATKSVTFTATPGSVGHFSLIPTSVLADGNIYKASCPIVEVVCNPNGSCDKGENYILCPGDCRTGEQDDTCDMVADGTNDPDCEYGVDPDYNPEADTDGDGVLDGEDNCPLTTPGEIVDSSGCSCAQKTCDDENPLTTDRCDPTTASCYHLSDPDQDQVPNATDNCPTVYNPGQLDSDDDGIGDECEIGGIDSDTTLDGGTYYISDPDWNGAITINASDTVLDCNGATINGTGSGYGVYIPDDINNVTIKHCSIKNYRYGIYIDGSSDNKLISNTLETNSYGIVLGSASNNTITHNLANSNAGAGIYLEDSAGNKIISNTVRSNGNIGIFIHTSSDNELVGNLACSNTNSDFSIYNSVNTGNNNTCDRPDGWNDNGTTGCSSACTTGPSIYLPVIFRTYIWGN